MRDFHERYGDLSAIEQLAASIHEHVPQGDDGVADLELAAKLLQDAGPALRRHVLNEVEQRLRLDENPLDLEDWQSERLRKIIQQMT